MSARSVYYSVFGLRLNRVSRVISGKRTNSFIYSCGRIIDRVRDRSLRIPHVLEFLLPQITTFSLIWKNDWRERDSIRTRRWLRKQTYFRELDEVYKPKRRVRRDMKMVCPEKLSSLLFSQGLFNPPSYLAQDSSIRLETVLEFLVQSSKLYKKRIKNENKDKRTLLRLPSV